MCHRSSPRKGKKIIKIKIKVIEGRRVLYSGEEIRKKGEGVNEVEFIEREYSNRQNWKLRSSVEQCRVHLRMVLPKEASLGHSAINNSFVEWCFWSNSLTLLGQTFAGQAPFWRRFWARKRETAGAKGDILAVYRVPVPHTCRWSQASQAVVPDPSTFCYYPSSTLTFSR